MILQLDIRAIIGRIAGERLSRDLQGLQAKLPNGRVNLFVYLSERNEEIEMCAHNRGKRSGSKRLEEHAPVMAIVIPQPQQFHDCRTNIRMVGPNTVVHSHMAHPWTHET